MIGNSLVEVGGFLRMFLMVIQGLFQLSDQQNLTSANGKLPACFEVNYCYVHQTIADSKNQQT